MQNINKLRETCYSFHFNLRDNSNSFIIDKQITSLKHKNQSTNPTPVLISKPSIMKHKIIFKVLKLQFRPKHQHFRGAHDCKLWLHFRTISRNYPQFPTITHRETHPHLHTHTHTHTHTNIQTDKYPDSIASFRSINRSCQIEG